MKILEYNILRIALRKDFTKMEKYDTSAITPEISKSFESACKRIIDNPRERPGIGTLGEKTLHAVLKNTLEPDQSRHEIKVGRFYADIANENGIIEIQTRNFNALRKKLEAFLQENTVTLVYPIPSSKWLIWIDKETGEFTPRRKSPKTGSVYDAFGELYKIKWFLTHPNLDLCLVFLDIVEYRNLDGWSSDRKKGSSRSERIPERLADIVHVRNVHDYMNVFVPDTLPDEFTAKDYKKATGMPLRGAQLAMNVLKYVGALTQTGKRGGAFVYRRGSDS